MLSDFVGIFCAVHYFFYLFHNPHGAKESGKMERKIVKAIIKAKKGIIQNHENGVWVSDLAIKYGLANSFCINLKNQESKVVKGVTVITKQRFQPLEVETLLLIWIIKKHLAGDSISQAIICEKVKDLLNYPWFRNGSINFTLIPMGEIVCFELFGSRTVFRKDFRRCFSFRPEPNSSADLFLEVQGTN